MTLTRPEPLSRTTHRGDHETLPIPVVRATGAAMNAVRDVERRHGPVVLVLGDRGAPRCIPAADFHPGLDDVHLGAVCCTPVHADRRRLLARPLSVVVVDVEHGAADGPTLGAGPDQHFVSIERDMRPRPA